MSDAIALPTAVDVLESRLRSGSSIEDLWQILRALQRLGLSKEDLVVHVERIRAVNEIQDDDEVLEDNCIDALDIINGRLPSFFLSWSPVETARIHLPKTLNREDLENAFERALRPTDLIPPRTEIELHQDLADGLVDQIYRRQVDHQSSLHGADFYRVPKAGLASRPAALLTVDDRLIYEALALKIEDQLRDKSSAHVTWPIGQPASADNYHRFSNSPQDWTSSYVIVTDIESYYESISHLLLIIFLEATLDVSVHYLHSLEGLLRAIMGTDIGLPQGPHGSDTFASAFLTPVDHAIEASGWSFARYADDYLIGADSMRDGRRKLEEFEAILRDVGLRSNARKTKIMRTSTYLERLGRPSRRIDSFRQELRSIWERELKDIEDADELRDELVRVGVEEDALWGLLYHQTVTLDQVIDRIGDLLTPGLIESYSRYLSRVGSQLISEDLPDDMDSVELNIRECLTVLAGAKTLADIRAVDAVLTWFPRLAENVSLYLMSIAEEHPEAVRWFLRQWLVSRGDTDWVTAWICHVATRKPEVVDELVRVALVQSTSLMAPGSLTSAEAVKALASAGLLTSKIWRGVLEQSSHAIRSELIFGVWAEPELYQRVGINVTTFPALE